jgi:uncharacterized glyoxalase superfamily protein PhnB
MPVRRKATGNRDSTAASSAVVSDNRPDTGWCLARKGADKPGRAWVLQPGTFGAYVVTDQVADIYARVQAAAGMRIVRELGPSDQGGEEFAIADPEGNLWSFGSYRGEAVG